MRLIFSFPPETPDQRRCCVAHDEKYYYGGTRRQRYLADRALYRSLRDAHMSWKHATAYYWAVRTCGGPGWMSRAAYFLVTGEANPARWSYGGRYYAYERET